MLANFFPVQYRNEVQVTFTINPKSLEILEERGEFESKLMATCTDQCKQGEVATSPIWLSKFVLILVAFHEK